MAIKIKKKTPLSNEPTTTLKSAGEASGKTKEDSKQPDQGPTPFIDKISVVMHVPADMAHASYLSIMTQTKDTEVFKSSQYKPPFNLSRRIAINCIPNSKKWPVLMASFDKSTQQALKFRVEFSPVDLGDKGMEELHAALMMLVDGGWGAFSRRPARSLNSAAAPGRRRCGWRPMSAGSSRPTPRAR